MSRHDRRRAAAIQRRKAKQAAKPVRAAAKPAPIKGRLSTTVQVRIQAADTAQPTKPRTFDIAAYTGEPMSIGYWDRPVIVDLDTLDLTAQTVPCLYDHCAYDPCSIVGQVQRLAVENGVLRASGLFTIADDLPPERNYARQVLNRADAGYQWQASIGGNPASMDQVEAGATVQVNGRSYAGPCYVARGVAIREISFVVLGGDRRSSAVVARHRNSNRPIKGAAMSFEEWLLSLGFEDATSLSEVQRANLQQLYNDEYPETATDTAANPPTNAATDPPVDEETPPPAQARGRRPVIRASYRPGDHTAEYRREIAAEEKRVADLRRIMAGGESLQFSITEAGQTRQVPLLAHAIASGWDANRTELERLRIDRGTGPAVISRSHERDCTVEALQGAMILRARGRLDHPSYQSPQAAALRLPAWLRAGLNTDQRQRAMEAAHRFGSMSMVDLCREACRLNGASAPYERTELIQAAFSSGGSLTNVFTTNVNAVLLVSYMESVDTTQGWVSEADVADFKTQDRPRVLIGEGLTKLPRGGEADHTSLTDVNEAYKIARYARQFVIDEQDIVDDNFSVFSDTPVRFGQAAARLRPDLVYAVLISNPTLTANSLALFHSTNGNLLTSAALAAAKLKAAASAMRLFRESSTNLNLMPTHLIVPPTLEFTAYELVNSTENIIAGTAGAVTERGNVNTLQRLGLTVVSEARLENGVTNPADSSAQSGSASTWWLASNQAHTIEVGYLRGTGRAPQVRSFVLDRGKWGMGWDVNMDIGVKALDWKGLIKNTA